MGDESRGRGILALGHLPGQRVGKQTCKCVCVRACSYGRPLALGTKGPGAVTPGSTDLSLSPAGGPRGRKVQVSLDPLVSESKELLEP